MFSSNGSIGNGAMDRATTRSLLLARLCDADYARLKLKLMPCALPLRKQLQVRGRAMENIVFIEEGIASMVIGTGSQRNIEVGLIGQEGVTGVSLILGAPISPYDIFMQAPGRGWSLEKKDMQFVMAASASFRNLLLLYCQTLMVQMAHTALANGRYTIEERLARWLLMTRDRSASGTAALTHEFLAAMLGVRRPGVTTALNRLEKRGLITTTRGSITILERGGLEDQSNGCYGAPEAEYELVFSPEQPRGVTGRAVA
jgi:CRP-like cAMP-binding protein